MNVREEQHSFDIPVEELTACDQLQHQVHMRLRLEYLLQSNLKLTAQKITETGTATLLIIDFRYNNDTQRHTDRTLYKVYSHAISQKVVPASIIPMLRRPTAQAELKSPC